MIYAVGTDLVEIHRFIKWIDYSDAQLSKIFSYNELQYARLVPCKFSERLAVRFAAKEAFYKALSSGTGFSYSLRTVCQSCEVEHNLQGAPQLRVNWEKLKQGLKDVPELTTHVSLSHTGLVAAAFVILELKK